MYTLSNPQNGPHFGVLPVDPGSGFRILEVGLQMYPGYGPLEYPEMTRDPGPTSVPCVDIPYTVHTGKPPGDFPVSLPKWTHLTTDTP